MRICIDCGKEINPKRVEALPNTQYCIKCSPKHVHKPVGFMIYHHKTAPEFVAIDANDKNSIYFAKRANERGR